FKICYFFFFQAEDGRRDFHVTGVQTCALPIFASAMLFNSQTTIGNIGGELIPDDGIAYDASVSDNVLAGAAGNIGLNVAAGVGNAQSNALAASVNGSGTIAKASADSEQVTAINTAE